MKSLNKVLSLFLCFIIILNMVPVIQGTGVSSDDSAIVSYTVPVISNEYTSDYVTIYAHDGKFFMSLDDIGDFTRSTLTEDDETLTLTHGIREIVITKATGHMNDTDIVDQGNIPLLEYNGMYLCEGIPMLQYLGAACSIHEEKELEVLMPLYTIWESIMPDYLDYYFDINKLYGGEDSVKINLVCAVLADILDGVSGHGLLGSYDIHMEDALFEVLNVDMMKYSCVQQSAAEENQKINDFLTSDVYGFILDGSEKTVDGVYEVLDYYASFYLNTEIWKNSYLEKLYSEAGDLKSASELGSQINKQVYTQSVMQADLKDVRANKSLLSIGMLAFDTAVTSYGLMQYDDDTRNLFARTINNDMIAHTNYHRSEWMSVSDKIANTLKSTESIVVNTAATKIAETAVDEVSKFGVQKAISGLTTKGNIYVAATQIGLYLASLINHSTNEAYSADLNAILLNEAQYDVTAMLTRLLADEYNKYHCSNAESLKRIKDMFTLYYRFVIAFSENMAKAIDEFGGRDDQKWVDWFSSTEEDSVANYAAEYLYRITTCHIVPYFEFGNLEDNVLTPDAIIKLSNHADELKSKAFQSVLDRLHAAIGHLKQLNRIDAYDESGSLINYSTYSYYDSGILHEVLSRDIDQGACVFELQTTYTYMEDNKLQSRITVNPEYPDESSGVEYTYDTQGRLIRSEVWEGGGVATTYEYDAQNRLIRATEESEVGTAEIEYRYDENGRLIHENRTSSEEETDETWTDTTVYSYDAEGRLSRKEMKGAYQTVIEEYDYTYLPFVIVDHCYDGGKHSFYVMLQDGSLEMQRVAVFDAPLFYTDADGYLAKVIDQEDYLGTRIYEFSYDGKVADPENGPFQMDSAEILQSSSQSTTTPQSTTSKMDLLGNWYSETANKAYIFTSTGNNWSVTGSGIQNVSGEYIEIDLYDRDTEFGGFDLGTDSTITFYRPKSDTKSISLNGDTLSMDGHIYKKAPSTITSQVLGRWNCGNLFVQFDGKKCTENTDGELRSESYYVLSDSLFVVWRSGSYRVREYSINGTTMTYQYNTYHKDGADSSASTLENLATAVVGTWRDDSYCEYFIYANGTYERYFNLYSSRGELELHNLEEQGTYEILDHEKIRLWVNGENVMYDDFIYNPQDDTLYMKYSDRTLTRFQ